MSRFAGCLATLIALMSCGPVQTSHVIIDWVDFIKWNGVSYLALPNAGAQLPATALGAQVGTVKKKVADVVDDPAYQTQNGDAAFLPIGTSIYALAGYRTSFRLAVNTTRVIVYEEDTDSRARVGSDILDLEGKVTSIDVATAAGDTRTISDPAIVSRCTELIEQSPVDQSLQPPESDAERITFHFRDGTQTERAFWPSAALLERGVRVPQELVLIVTNALR